MANVKRLLSPRELLDYLNELTLPAGGFHGTGAAVGATGFDIIDCGARYTVLEETPFLITTVNSERDLEAFLGSLAGTLREVVPKKEGGVFTYYSIVDEVLGQANGFSMIISDDQQSLEDDMNGILDAAGTVDMIIEHDNKTVLIYTP